LKSGAQHQRQHILESAADTFPARLARAMKHFAKN
jgi:hypothetical protein